MRKSISNSGDFLDHIAHQTPGSSFVGLVLFRGSNAGELTP